MSPLRFEKPWSKFIQDNPPCDFGITLGDETDWTFKVRDIRTRTNRQRDMTSGAGGFSSTRSRQFIFSKITFKVSKRLEKISRHRNTLISQNFKRSLVRVVHASGIIMSYPPAQVFWCLAKRNR